MILRLLLLSPLFALCLSVATNITVDDTDSSITYVGSWNHGINERDSYGGGHTSTGSAKAKATLIFNGTAIHYLSALFGDPHDVSTLLTLDSNPGEWVNLSASKWTMYDIRWSKTGLTNGLHTLVISPGTSSSGQRATWGEVDGFIITQGGDNLCTVPSPITTCVFSDFWDGRSVSSVPSLASTGASNLLSTSTSSSLVKRTGSSIFESSSAAASTFDFSDSSTSSTFASTETFNFLSTSTSSSSVKRTGSSISELSSAAASNLLSTSSTSSPSVKRTGSSISEPSSAVASPSEVSDERFSSVPDPTSGTLASTGASNLLSTSTSTSSVNWTGSSISESSATASPVPLAVNDSPVTTSIFNWPPAPSGQSSDVNISGTIQYSGNWTAGDGVCGTALTMFTDSADASFTLSFQGSELFIGLGKFPGAGNLSLSINGGDAQVFDLNAPEITCGYISPQVPSLSRRSLAGRDSADAENQCTGKVINPPVQLDGASYRREVSTGHALQIRQYWIIIMAIVCNGLVTVPFLGLQ